MDKIQYYTNKINNIIACAIKDGISIKAYQMTIGDLITEEGIGVYGENFSMTSHIPTYKLGDNRGYKK